jgi:hypothetical protein
MPRVVLLLVGVAFAYSLTWHLLTSHALPSGWLAPVLVAQTYLLVGLAFLVLNRRPARRHAERRGTLRVPAALPIRYATEEGQVGIGTLLDITETGAGLLLPGLTLDATHLWIQFLWFDDRIGAHGRVIHARETDRGVRLGLELQPLHPETRALLTDFVIPYGAARHGDGARTERGRRVDGTGQGLAWPVPVQVEKGGFCVWAIAESLDEHGAVLLLPASFAEGERVRLAAWGHPVPREAEVLRWEALRAAPPGLFRIAVRHRSD